MASHRSTPGTDARQPGRGFFSQMQQAGMGDSSDKLCSSVRCGIYNVTEPVPIRSKIRATSGVS